MLSHGEVLAKKRIVLASASPRRLEILRDNGGLSNLVIKKSGFAEDMDKATFSSPAEYVTEYAKQKVLYVAEEEKDADMIIGCDTVVVRDGTILEKPSSKEDAVAMLTSLSGRRHTVYSGVAIVCGPAGARTTELFHAETQVSGPPGEPSTP